MKTALTPTALCLAANLAAAVAAGAAHPCAGDTREKAKALLTLHMDGAGMAVSVGDRVIQRPSVRALKGRGKFDVLEVTGYVYKAQYRIRMIYAAIPDACVLMGQEILEISDPY